MNSLIGTLSAAWFSGGSHHIKGCLGVMLGCCRAWRALQWSLLIKGYLAMTVYGRSRQGWVHVGRGRLRDMVIMDKEAAN